MTLPVSIVLPVAAMAYRGGSQIMAKDFGGLSRDFTGFDVTNNQMSLGTLIPTYAPILAGAVIHKTAGYFGVNQKLAAAGVPFLRV
jgi:hypothetical protein